LSVDGVIAEGRVVATCVSTYPLDCYSCLRRCAPIALLQLDDTDPVVARAHAYLEPLLAALPCGSLTTAFHCELFDSASRGIMLCEIACRTGGGRISDTFRETRGIDLAAWSAMGQASLDPAGARCVPAHPSHLMGFALFPSPGGVLLGAPTQSPPRSVIDYQMQASLGNYMTRCGRVSEYAADVLFSAPTRLELEGAYQEAVDWVQSWLVWGSEIASTCESRAANDGPPIRQESAHA
jgi:hypothetical protein